MKTLFKLATFFLLFVLTTSIAVAQKSKKKKDKGVTNISINNFSGSIEIKEGFWTATKEDGIIYIQLMNSKRNNGSFFINFFIKEDELKRNVGATSFELNRESGMMIFNGPFPQIESTGKFIFTKNTDFKNFLKSKILTNISKNEDYYYFKLFLGNVTKNYVNRLQQEGYKPTLKQLGKLGIHNVSLDYIDALNKTNYKGLELDMLIKFAIHDISIDYIKDLAKVGYGNIDANMVKKFAIHDISIDYIKGLAKVGYGDIDANMVKKFAIHSISLDYIKNLSTIGYGNLDAEMLKKFAVHSIMPAYIKSLLKTDIHKPDASTIKKAKIHSVSANFINKARNKGHDSKELSDYIRLKIRGI